MAMPKIHHPCSVLASGLFPQLSDPLQSRRENDVAYKRISARWKTCALKIGTISYHETHTDTPQFYWTTSKRCVTTTPTVTETRTYEIPQNRSEMPRKIWSAHCHSEIIRSSWYLKSRRPNRLMRLLERPKKRSRARCTKYGRESSIKVSQIVVTTYLIGQF